MEKKRRTILAVILVATIVVSVVGTYAFFTTQGRIENQKLTVQTGSLALTFEDNDDGVSKQMNLGDSVTKEFIIRNTGTQAVITNMLWSNLKNTYLEESLSYKLEYKTTSTGTYSPVETASATIPHTEAAQDKALAKNLTIPSGAEYYYKLTITFEDLDINQDSDKTAMLATKFKLGDIILTASEKTLAALNLKAKSGKPDFASAVTTDETKDGLYAMEDDYGTSYYFRGAVENNYVKFGTWANTSENGEKAGKDMWWRIIRINGDGSLRIMYDGTSSYENGDNNSDRVAISNLGYNKDSDAKYVGWMYAPADRTEDATTPSTSVEEAQNNLVDSIAKKAVDEWYNNNIVSGNYDSAISDNIFCNDRSFSADNTGEGFGTSQTYYRAHSFTTSGSTISPTLKCANKNDAFTKSDTIKGNGALEYPVGLITADEVVIAGGKNSSSETYLKKCGFSTMTPDFASNYIGVLTAGNGILSGGSSNFVSNRRNYAPVVNLSPEYVRTLTGTGTIIDPYRA